jgi:hypothetical protein
VNDGRRRLARPGVGADEPRLPGPPLWLADDEALKLVHDEVDGFSGGPAEVRLVPGEARRRRVRSDRHLTACAPQGPAVSAGMAPPGS